MIAILDYDAGNLTSVERALRHLGYDARVTADPAVVDRAQRVVFPGVGAAGSCMRSLRAKGLDLALQRVVAEQRRLVVICVGMQLLFEHSAEDGGVPCLGILPGTVERFQVADRTLKIPHMGWNPTAMDDPLLSRDIAKDSAFYYVHSYHCRPGPGVEVIATADHGGRFVAGVRRGSITAFQFHPEKSGPVGLQLLRNVLG